MDPQADDGRDALTEDNTWVTVRTPDDVDEFRRRLTGSSSYWWPDIGPVGNRTSISFTHRMGRLGPITIMESNFREEAWVDGGDRRPHYHVTLPVETPRGTANCRPALVSATGSFPVYPPVGKMISPRSVGRRLAVMIDRHAVEDALADALGRSVPSQIDFLSITPTYTARSWMSMVWALTEQLFRPDSILRQPMVGMPFVESVARGLLLAADHPYRAALQGDAAEPSPRAICTAIEIIEAEAHRPLTVSALAARSYVSVRSLQHGFRTHVGTTPMAYLREVRLRRARRELLESEPSIATVAAIAVRWGFTNVGRFASAYAAHYGENPAVTLRRPTTKPAPRAVSASSSGLAAYSHDRGSTVLQKNSREA